MEPTTPLALSTLLGIDIAGSVDMGTPLLWYCKMLITGH